MRLRLARAVTFRAHHRLARPERTPEENRAEFGWTVEPHAHRYRCEIIVSRPADEARGMVIDLAILDRILSEQVTTPFGGRHLHRDVPAFQDRPPTTEAIAEEIFRRVASRLPDGCRLDRVAVEEDDTLRGECIGG